MLVAFSLQPPGLPPVFRGRKATEQVRRELLPSQELETLLLRDTDPYLGEPPPVFRQVSKGKNIDILRGLDWLSRSLDSPGHQRLRDKLGFPLRNPIRKMMKSGDLTVAQVGSGMAGTVYRLDLGGETFAFKVFGDWLRDFHPFREAATGMFFTARPTRDVSALYAANPFAKWTLTEFIGAADTLADRPGKTLTEQGYKISDECAQNRINGIRVDHGGRVSDLQGHCIAGDRFVWSQLIRSDQHRNTYGNNRASVGSRFDVLSV